MAFTIFECHSVAFGVVGWFEIQSVAFTIFECHSVAFGVVGWGVGWGEGPKGQHKGGGGGE
jgi:hypothetical protein